MLTHGRNREVGSGEIPVELNEQPTKVFVIVEGKLEALRVSDKREEGFAVCVDRGFYRRVEFQQ